MGVLLLGSLALLVHSLAQNVGSEKENVHLKLDIEECTGAQQSTKAHTLDHNWRWLHTAGDYVNCYEDNEWDSEFCPDPVTCT